MLRYVSKTRFEENCLGKKPIKTIRLDSFQYKWPYYEIPEKESWVMYIVGINAFVVFGSSDIGPSDLTVDFSDWNLNQISNKPDPRYILNLMKMYTNFDHDFGKVCSNGVWELVNSRTNERIEFSIKKSSDYFESVGIGYPEKLEIPLNETKIYTKNNFIEDLCYGLRGYFT